MSRNGDRVQAARALASGDAERAAALLEAKFGPRTYTPEQAEVIERAVRERKPLDVPPLLTAGADDDDTPSRGRNER